MDIEVFCPKESRRSWIQRVVIGILLATFVFGCKDPVRRTPIPSCTDIDTTPMDESVAERGSYLTAPEDSAMSREDSALVEKYRVAGDVGLADREDFLAFLDLLERLQNARRNHELTKICPIVIRESRRMHPDDPGREPIDRDFCARAASNAGDFRAAMEYLGPREMGIAEVKIHRMFFDGQNQPDRIRIRAEINSLWRRDREVIRLLVPWLWAGRPLRLAILRSYQPEEIVAEFDRAIDSMNVADYEDAPPSIRAKADTLSEHLGKRRKIGWTRLFGVELVMWPLGEEPFFGFPREAYAKEITESNLYREMYCLPSSKDSLAPIQNGGPR